MKKVSFLAAVALATLASCSGNDKAAQAEAAAPEALIIAEQTDSSETIDALYAQNDSTTGVDVVTLPVYGSIVDLDNDDLYRPDTKVDGLTVLDFNATWCGPCKQLHPVFAEAAKKYTNVKFVSVDIDRCKATAAAFDIKGVPTIVILSPTAKAQRYEGTGDLLPAEKFDAIINKSL